MIVFDKAEELIDYTITTTDNYKYFAKKRRFTFVDRMQNGSCYRLIRSMDKLYNNIFEGDG